MFEDELKAFEAESFKFPADSDNLTEFGSDLLKLSQHGITLGVSKLLNTVAILTLDKAVERGPTNHEALWWLGSAHMSLAYLTSTGDSARIHFDKALECFQKADQLFPGRHAYMKSLRESVEDREWYVADENREPYEWGQRGNGTGSAASSSAKALHSPKAMHETNDSAASSSAKHEPKLHKAIRKNGGPDPVSQQINGGGSPASSSAKDQLELHKAIHKHGGLYQISQQTSSGGGPAATLSSKGSATNKNSDLKYDIFGCGMLAVGVVAWIAMANFNVPL